MPKQTIEAFAHDFRDAIEPCWGVDTSSYAADLFPEGYEIPPSGGQSVPTSGLLLDELREAFPDERFRLTVGAIYLGRAAVLAHHTYVTHHPVLGRSPTIIDATADQAPGITERVVYKDMSKLAARGVVYLAFNQYEEVPPKICEDTTPVTPASTRIALLRQRMGDWRKMARRRP